MWIKCNLHPKKKKLVAKIITTSSRRLLRICQIGGFLPTNFFIKLFLYISRIQGRILYKPAIAINIDRNRDSFFFFFFFPFLIFIFEKLRKCLELLFVCFFFLIIIFFSFTILYGSERARDLADKVGGRAMSLYEVQTLQPEKGMVLTNATSVGMEPNFNDTPISKVFIFFSI